MLISSMAGQIREMRSFWALTHWKFAWRRVILLWLPEIKMIQTRQLPCADLIPAELQGEVFCLKAEDHYLRIYTSAGEALVLFCFSKAIKSLSQEKGMLVHRSFWVARQAVKKARRVGQRQYLDLLNGLSVPVSRSRMAQLRDAQWLQSPRAQPARGWRLVSHWLKPGRWYRPVVAGFSLSLGVMIGAGLMHFSSSPPSANTNILAETTFANGWQEYLRDTPQSFTLAAGYFNRAVAIDQDFGKAYGALASLYHSAAVRGWNRQWGQPLHETYRLAYRNLLSADRHPSAMGHAAEAQMLIYRLQNEEAMVESTRAIAMDPENPAGHLGMANSLIIAGLPDVAVGFLDHARKLGHPDSPSTLWARGMAAFTNNDFNLAANYFERCLKQSPEMNSMPLVAAYGHLGRRQEAAVLINKEKARRTPANPLELATVMDGMIFRHKEDAKRFTSGLRKAGL